MCEELPSPLILPFSPKLCNKLVFWPQYFAKTTKLPRSVRGLVHLAAIIDIDAIIDIADIDIIDIL